MAEAGMKNVWPPERTNIPSIAEAVVAALHAGQPYTGTFTYELAITVNTASNPTRVVDPEVVDAFRDGVLATCVGPVTAAAFEMWGVPTYENPSSMWRCRT